jgi:divinyl chlorophyllide a 8-vinyl-reductase
MRKTTIPIIASILLLVGELSNAFPANSYRRQGLSRAPFSKSRHEVRTSSFIESFQEKDGVGTRVNSEDSKTVVIAGATGYIGRAVVRESVARGYKTIALVRSLTKIQTPEGKALYGEAFEGAEVVQMDVEDVDALTKFMTHLDEPVDTVVSCLASPIGTKREAYAIDYQATLNCLNAGRDERVKARHFVLLSAFCVQKPLLQLQQAKLKFEAELQAQSDLSWSIVRPTAFFKSVSGQLDGIQQGNPYVLFGDGKVTRCNPICENELAQFMLNSMTDTSKQNKIMNIGGPDEPLTNHKLGELMFQAIGVEPKFVYAPTWIFDSIIQPLQVLATVFKSEALEDAAEYGRIGKYYAVEDMLTVKPEEKYGQVTMLEHYNKIASKGQDPFTPM